MVITHLQVFYEEDIDFQSKSKSAEELFAELWELTLVCRDNLFDAQKLQKQAHNKGMKPKSYVLDNKIWLNSKYIKTKQNQKLKTNFFPLFQVLHLVKKQAWKLKLLKKWRIHDVFYMLLLEQDITRKGQANENITRLKFEAGNSKEYEVEAI